MAAWPRRASRDSSPRRWPPNRPNPTTPRRERADAPPSTRWRTLRVQARDVDITLTPAVKESLKPFVVNLRRGKFSTTANSRRPRTRSTRSSTSTFRRRSPNAAGDSHCASSSYAHGGLVGEKRRPERGVEARGLVAWPTASTRSTSSGKPASSRRSSMLSRRSCRHRALPRATRSTSSTRRSRPRPGERRRNRIWARHETRGGACRRRPTAARGTWQSGSAISAAAWRGRRGPRRRPQRGLELPRVLRACVLWTPAFPKIETLQFLAPAITVDGFFASLAPRLGSIGPLTMFTMKDSFERDDNCEASIQQVAALSHSSMRLEESARDRSARPGDLGPRRSAAEAAVRPGRKPNRPRARGRLVHDRRAIADRRRESTSHGGFDDDPATMNSVLRRVLGLTGFDEVPIGVRAARAERWKSRRGRRGHRRSRSGGWRCRSRQTAVGHLQASRRPRMLATARGARRALCVGINNYKRKPLRGCVADAERWAATLRALGFTLDAAILDTQATAQTDSVGASAISFAEARRAM